MAKPKMTATRYPGVYRLPDGRYAVRAVARTEDGRQINRTVTLAPGTDEQAARLAVIQLKAEVDAATAQATSPAYMPLPHRHAPMTVTDYADIWFAGKVKTIKPSVAVQYEGCLSKILPLLGERQIRDITRRDLEEWVVWAQSQTRVVGKGEEAKEVHYSQDTLRAWWRVLGLLMRDAMADLDLDRDPTARVKPPKMAGKPKRERRTLSRDQVQALLAAAEKFAPKRHAEIATLVLTGMRAGEVYALHWEDIDFERKCIHISRAHWHGQEGTVKTDDPRVVPLLPRLAEVLKEQRLTLQRKGHRALKSGLVFPNDKGGYRLPQSLYDALDLAVEGAKLDLHVTPQVLRRTFNTLMMLAGTDRIALRSMMGHTSEEMTQRYSGVGLEVKQAAVKKLFGE